MTGEKRLIKKGELVLIANAIREKRIQPYNSDINSDFFKDYFPKKYPAHLFADLIKNISPLGDLKDNEITITFEQRLKNSEETSGTLFRLRLRKMMGGNVIGKLPIPPPIEDPFLYWGDINGEQITENTIFTKDTTLYTIYQGRLPKPKDLYYYYGRTILYFTGTAQALSYKIEAKRKGFFPRVTTIPAPSSGVNVEANIATIFEQPLEDFRQWTITVTAVGDGQKYLDSIPVSIYMGLGPYDCWTSDDDSRLFFVNNAPAKQQGVDNDELWLDPDEGPGPDPEPPPEEKYKCEQIDDNLYVIKCPAKQGTPDTLLILDPDVQ